MHATSLSHGRKLTDRSHSNISFIDTKDVERETYSMGQKSISSQLNEFPRRRRADEDTRRRRKASRVDWKKKKRSHFIREHALMTSAKFSDFLTPPPFFVHIWNWFVVLNSHNLPSYNRFSMTPLPLRFRHHIWTLPLATCNIAFDGGRVRAPAACTAVPSLNDRSLHDRKLQRLNMSWISRRRARTGANAFPLGGKIFIRNSNETL